MSRSPLDIERLLSAMRADYFFAHLVGLIRRACSVKEHARSRDYCQTGIVSVHLQVAIGAGPQRWEGWVPTDREDLDLTSRTSFEAWFGTERATAMVCEHVWEHLDHAEARLAAKLCFDFLEPGGRLRVAVPDGLFPDAEYQRMVQVGGPGPADHPAADHNVVYDYTTFPPVFASAGFTVTLLEWWDNRGNFHHADWELLDGPIGRATKLDTRNEAWRAGNGPPGFTSLLLDAVRPPAHLPDA
jgi:predicted SAM-dependent methyltransferase